MWAFFGLPAKSRGRLLPFKLRTCFGHVIQVGTKTTTNGPFLIQQNRHITRIAETEPLLVTAAKEHLPGTCRTLDKTVGTHPVKPNE